MSSTYTNSLRLTLQATGENSGTWGDIVNGGVTSLVDASIAGTATVTHTDAANYTLTVANGATDEARRMFLNIAGTLTAARNVVCPSVSKLYFLTNNTTGGFAVTLKTSAGTGISVPSGKSAALYCDGTNVLEAFNNISSLGALTVTSLTNSGLTSGRVTYAGASGLLQDSANLTFNGTTLTANTLGLTNALTASNGGTGFSSYTTGDTLFASGGSTISKLALGTNGFILTAGASAPQYTNPASLTVGTATTAGKSTNIAGGAAGSVPYQTALDTTSLLALGTNGYVLTAGASAPTYVAQNTLSVGSAATATSATTATNVAGGAAGSIVYQTALNTTGLLALGTSGFVLTAGASAPAWSNSLTLTGNLSAAALIPTGSSAPTTGLYAPTGSTVALAVNGNTPVYADASGNVGVGTGVTTLGAKLDVVGTTRSSGGFLPTVNSVSNQSTAFTINSDSLGQYNFTAQTSNFTFNADSGSPTNGTKIVIRITTGVATPVITFTGGVSKGFRPMGVTLSVSGSNFTYTTTSSKTVYFGCIYNSDAARWDIVALAQEA